MLTALAALAGCQDAAPAGPLDRLAELHDSRSIGPRISIETRHRPCVGAGAGRDAMAPITCSSDLPPPDADLLALASSLSAQVSSRADADALHAAGLVDLLWRGESGNSVDRAISHLTAAADIATHPADALADLSAAYLIRAEGLGSPRDLLNAADAADRALALDSGSPAARYNLALALDRLAVDIEAGHAWSRYEESDGHSGWGEEARTRVAALRGQEPSPAPPRLGAEDAAIRAFASEAPQEARLHGWDVVLGEWAAAVLRGDRDTADAKLRMARTLGEALASAGGDATLADAVGVIDAAAVSPLRTRQLASAHHAYSTGREWFLANRFDAAAETFASALSMRHGSPVLQGWLEVYHAGTIMLSGRLEEGWTAFNRVLERTDSRRHPALAAQAAAAMSTARLRAGRFEDGIEHAATAAALFARAREREARGSQLVLQSEAELAIGATERGYRSNQEALLTLRPYRSSVWRYNALVTLAPAAAGEGLGFAAIRLMNEAVAAADRAGSLVHRIEGALGRARILTMAGDTAGASRDVARARALLAQMEPGYGRTWLQTDLGLAEAAMAASSDPKRAIAELDSILSVPGAIGTETRLLATLVARADAQVVLGNPEAAAADLNAAAELITRASSEISRSGLRAALLDGARSIFDRLVLFELARGEPERALEHLEQGRASFVRRTNGGVPDVRIPATRPGETALSYMLAGDTVFAWVISSGAVEIARTIVSRDELTRTIARVRASLELGAGSETLREDLATLHDLLVAPLGSPERPLARRLVIVADGEIADVPFPALIDRTRNRYLVEDHEMRFAPTLRDARALRRSATASGPTRSRNAVFVGDPGEPQGSAGFAPLPESAEEVRTLATYYPGANLITGDSMDARAVTSALRSSEIFHFAGHAVFDEARPELSFLVLGAGPDGDPERLRAVDLYGMDLRHVRLVVLAACETLRSGVGRSGGFAGFAGILLETGVDALVGSLWRVDDAATTDLMLAFHHAYASSGDGPASLRAAQLRLLASTEPALSSPAAWAAFRYAGY